MSTCELSVSTGQSWKGFMILYFIGAIHRLAGCILWTSVLMLTFGHWSVSKIHIQTISDNGKCKFWHCGPPSIANWLKVKTKHLLTHKHPHLALNKLAKTARCYFILTVLGLHQIQFNINPAFRHLVHSVWKQRILPEALFHWNFITLIYDIVFNIY